MDFAFNHGSQLIGSACNNLLHKLLQMQRPWERATVLCSSDAPAQAGLHTGILHHDSGAWHRRLTTTPLFGLRLLMHAVDWIAVTQSPWWMAFMASSVFQFQLLCSLSLDRANWNNWRSLRAKQKINFPLEIFNCPQGFVQICASMAQTTGRISQKKHGHPFLVILSLDCGSSLHCVCAHRRVRGNSLEPRQAALNDVVMIAVCSLDYFHSQCTQQNNLIVLQRQRRFGTAADAAFTASLGYLGELCGIAVGGLSWI